MKIVLDHDLPKRLRLLLQSHLALTARQMSWEALSNGRLIAAAETNEFDILLTADKKMFEQQRHLDREISLVVLSTSLMVYLEPNVALILAAVQRAVPGSFEMVEVPQNVPGE